VAAAGAIFAGRRANENLSATPAHTWIPLRKLMNCFNELSKREGGR
jgi:hypothetical protein